MTGNPDSQLRVANQPQEKTNKRKKPPANPLIRGIVVFCQRHPQLCSLSNDEELSQRELSRNHPQAIHTAPDSIAAEASDGHYTSQQLSLSLADLPKRYTAYPPLLLLPLNFPTHSPRWAEFYSRLSELKRAALLKCIAEDGFRKLGISRIAINAPIAAEVGEAEGTNNEETQTTRPPVSASHLKDDALKSQQAHDSSRENFVRSPSGLMPVFGDWGPHLPPQDHRRRTSSPTAEDCASAFWTSASQHEGITQIWAPLYTMFSRGNISEKARILGLSSVFPGMSPHELGDQQLETVDVADFYVGIGYFASCYLKRGVRRVFGWDINPWSIEGFRRGCERNGWRCLVVRVDEDGKVLGDGEVEGLVKTIRDGDKDGRASEVVRCVAILGDNRFAVKLLKEIKAVFDLRETDSGVNEQKLNFRHANLGLLPTSEPSWLGAVDLLTSMATGAGGAGWLHVHENVDVREIDAMAKKIVRTVTMLANTNLEGHRFHVSCSHIEQVKTYAPGVMHCVFDIEIQSNG